MQLGTSLPAASHLSCCSGSWWQRIIRHSKRQRGQPQFRGVLQRGASVSFPCGVHSPAPISRKSSVASAAEVWGSALRTSSGEGARAASI